MVEDTQHLQVVRVHMPINVKDVHRYIAHPQHLGGVPDFDVPLPVTVDGYDMWEIQTLMITVYEYQ